MINFTITPIAEHVDAAGVARLPVAIWIRPCVHIENTEQRVSSITRDRAADGAGSV